MALFRRRTARVQRLLEKYDVVLLQETRASTAEVEFLRSHFLGAELYGTCGSGAGVGRIITMITRRLAAAHPARESTLWRCLGG